MCFLVSKHIVWRDEVRAVSLALDTDSVWSILLPLLYVLRRATHALIPEPE